LYICGKIKDKTVANIIGRKNEIEELGELYKSDRAEFVAVYGRRRVGKTFLVDEVLKDKITFRHAGLSPVDENGKKNQMKEQLEHFYNSLMLCGMEQSSCPKSWLEAFFMLEKFLQSIDDGRRQVVFLDELPWMDTPRAGFITAFEGFWNTWACHRDNFMLVVCGSANSWVLDNLMNNHGGLYGRVTYEIKLSPFSLSECEAYYKDKGILLSRYDMVQSYMILGGIPYYLSYFKKGKSLAENIDALFFSPKPRLRDEFDRLLSSVFTNPEAMKKIILLLSSSRAGFTRQEISKRTGIESSGVLSDMLQALTASDFVIKYIPFGMRKRDEHYKLVDPFCKFYIHFVEGHDSIDTDFWSQNLTSQEVTSWRGYAFEDVCLNHIDKIKVALGIPGVVSQQSEWAIKGTDGETGSQIDLIINRRDNVVNMCEMKYYSDDFKVDRNYYRTIARRTNALAENLPRKAVIHSTLITTYGLEYNEYSGAFQKVITMDQLF
jgi:AAA+ ATPase superfamily predicted ATPase